MPKKWKVETEQIQQFANPISIHFQLCQGQDASVSGASRVSAIEIWSLAESSGKAVDWGNLQKSLVTDESMNWRSATAQITASNLRCLASQETLRCCALGASTKAPRYQFWIPWPLASHWTPEMPKSNGSISSHSTKQPRAAFPLPFGDWDRPHRGLLVRLGVTSETHVRHFSITNLKERWWEDYAFQKYWHENC